MAEKRETSYSDGCKRDTHYWILDDRNFGVCKTCGAKKKFAVKGLPS
jgi:hypothetical protein